MAKEAIKGEPEFSLQRIQQMLREENACYVLITCSEPSTEGNMEVRLVYEGDETLAAYLVDQARDAFHERIDRQLESK